MESEGGGRGVMEGRERRGVMEGESDGRIEGGGVEWSEGGRGVRERGGYGVMEGGNSGRYSHIITSLSLVGGPLRTWVVSDHTLVVIVPMLVVVLVAWLPCCPWQLGPCNSV